jgi:hypothetical protein
MFYNATASEKQKIADCYAMGGSPVFNLGGGYAFCDRGRSTPSRPFSVMLNAEGFYNASGCGLMHPFNKQKREQCESASAQKREDKSATAQSEAALNQAIAAGIYAKSQQPQQTGMSTGKIIALSVGGLAVVGLVIFAIKKARG